MDILRLASVLMQRPQVTEMVAVLELLKLMAQQELQTQVAVEEDVANPGQVEQAEKVLSF